ncbi:MAG TPA: TonB-dependent receptor [Bacteroidales bacterium]|nr:TonB-dependent receptor [Bacteroidales bacterium]
MKHVRNYFILLVQLSFSTLVYCQNHTPSLRGTVTDKITKYPLPGANIIILESNPLTGTVSDTSGNFCIHNIPAGGISIRISYLGYSDVIFRDIEISGSKDLVLDVELEEKAFQGKEVVITAQGDRTTPINKMATVSIRRYTTEETGLFAGTRNDVSRMASNYAGVKGSGDARNDIIIRGNSPAGLLWRLDDVDIPNPNHFAAFGTSGGPVGIFRNYLLQNSDFITGAFPAEYGNALSGVFDLRSVNGNSERHRFSYHIGFDGIGAGAEGPVKRSKGSSYFVDYRVSMLDLWAKMGVQMGTGNGVPRYQDLFFKVVLPKTKIGNLTVFGYGGMSYIKFADSERDTTKNRIDMYGTRGWNMTNRSNQAVIGVSDHFLISKSSYFKFTIAATYHDFTFYHDSVTPATRETFPYEVSADRECKLLGNIFFIHKFNSRHNIKTGIKASLLHNDIRDSIFDPDIALYVRHNDYQGYSALFQAYADWQFRISENFTMNFGVHGQLYSYSKDFSVEPRLGLKWDVAPLHSLSLGFGMHSQMIPATIFFSQEQLSDNAYRLSNDRLGFSRSLHGVLAYDWNVTENTRLKTEVYYQYLYNIPVEATRSSSYSLLNEGASFDVTAPDNLHNTGTGYNYGIELTAERFLSKGFYYLGTASYAISKYRGSDKVLRNTAFNGGYNVNLLGGKEFRFKSKKSKPLMNSKSLTVSLKTTLGSGRYYTPINEQQSYIEQETVYYENNAFTEQLPLYSRTDFKIAYTMKGRKISLECSLEISNIFNQKNICYIAFDKNTGKAYNAYQMGTMLVPQYRLIF